MDLKQIALRYFSAFAAKDLGVIAELLDPAMTLRDWTTSVNGREEVLAHMKSSLDAVGRVAVVPVNVYQQGSTLLAELSIFIDAEAIQVIDLIEFSADSKISAIRAFKG